MAKLSEEFIKAYKKANFRKYPIRLGGVVALKNYWDMLGRNFYSIDKKTAKVIAEEKEDGAISLYIDLELMDNGHERLPIYSQSLEEDDMVDINSIIVIFLNSKDCNTFLMYDALCKVRNRFSNSPADIRNFISRRCSEIMEHISEQEQKNNLSSMESINLSNVKVSYNHYEDTSDREIWEAMTDGMYGDYPDEGYDGDYEFKGY